jgi:hypothetical protein
MFPTLLAYLQKVLHEQYLVYCVRVISVSCTRVKVKGKGHPVTGHEGPTGGVEV